MFTIDFYYPRWGSEKTSWYEFLGKIKSAFYTGVEVYPLLQPNDKKEILEGLVDNDLRIILLHTVDSDGSDFDKYCYQLEKNLYELAGWQSGSVRPEFINSQTGREYFTRDQMRKCFAICNRVSNDTSITIVHETHRNKWSYAAHVVKEYLEEFPELLLALDLSHWVCVSESYLEDQKAALDLAISRTFHLHARVGHPQGPQVSDPRSPENSIALFHHLRLWDSWVKFLMDRGVNHCTITPEFGPYPYMQYRPFSNEPISDQWEINNWMRDLLRNRYCD